MEMQELFVFKNGMRLERIQYTGEWRLSWPHDDKEVSRNLSIQSSYVLSLVKALEA